jgi:oligopeptide/dipeptide ABC transporter ATP-binding protein
MSTNLLEVRDLQTTFATARGPLRAVDGVSVDVARGETIGIVGESGSGKSALGLSIMRLIEFPGRISGGRIKFDGVDLMEASPSEMRSIRGRRISMIFQDATSTLSPVLRVGEQIAEIAVAHGTHSRRAARELAVEMLHAVGIANPTARANAYPHELSGGMQQRVIIACALALNPELVIADEPTTALDVTVQEQILGLMRELSSGRRETAVILISHDLGVIAEMCARTYVMYCGNIIEARRTADLLDDPRHPYTRGLLASIPRIDGDIDVLSPVPGTIADPVSPPAGCRFHPRCAMATDLCRNTIPSVQELGPGAFVMCHYGTSQL